MAKEGDIALVIVIFYIFVGFLSSFFNVGGVNISGDEISEDISGINTISTDSGWLTQLGNTIGTLWNMFIFTLKMITLQITISTNDYVSDFFNFFIALLNFIMIYDSRSTIFKIIDLLPFP